MKRCIWLGLFSAFCVICVWVLPRVDSRADGLRPPAVQQANRPNFEVRLIGQPNGLYDNIRFHTSKGDAWVQIGTKWEKITETGPLPIGDYDIQLAPLPNNDLLQFA